MCKQKLRQEQRTTGFTLIELLTVIAIISILAAILFPVFARARESARRAGCMSNMKQIGLGFMMYAQDYDERFPPFYANNIGTSVANRPPGGCWSGNSHCDRWFWQQLIYPYTKDMQIYKCPSQTGSNSVWLGQYGINGLVVTSSSTTGSTAHLHFLKLAAISAPSMTYMCMDAGGYTMGFYQASHPASSQYLPGSGEYLGITDPASILGSHAFLADDLMTGRHFHGVNMAFADGHVKWLKSLKVLNEAKQCTNCAAIQPTAKSAWNPYNAG